MKNLLLHTCCGPCFIYPHSLLKERYNVTSFYFNPNIHPSMEYVRRVEALAGYCKGAGVDLRVGDYKPEEYFRQVAGTESDRCRICYSIRLKEAAEFAAEKGYDLFSTTLSVSPYQKHDLIEMIGTEAGNKCSVEFKYWDFRPGFRSGQDRAKELEMYRQPYCGCVFSEMERYSRKLKKAVDGVVDREHEFGTTG
ncbi:MAG: epoxyqueuosine reductase QueH [Actinobacteria bacterium]|nr:epoxyqueuosine reductase QueH [Actinomycetota bacterium]